MAETTAPVSGGSRLRCYFDTASLLDLDEFRLIGSLRVVNAVIVEEVLDEIHNLSLVGKLKLLTEDRGSSMRAHVPKMGGLHRGEAATIRAMLADERECVYVSNDGASVGFVRRNSAAGMTTSDFVIWLHEHGHIADSDVRRILDNAARHPTRECRERLRSRLE